MPCPRCVPVTFCRAYHVYVCRSHHDRAVTCHCVTHFALPVLPFTFTILGLQPPRSAAITFVDLPAVGLYYDTDRCHLPAITVILLSHGYVAVLRYRLPFYRTTRIQFCRFDIDYIVTFTGRDCDCYQLHLQWDLITVDPIVDQWPYSLCQLFPTHTPRTVLDHIVERRLGPIPIALYLIVTLYCAIAGYGALLTLLLGLRLLHPLNYITGLPVGQCGMTPMITAITIRTLHYGTTFVILQLLLSYGYLIQCTLSPPPPHYTFDGYSLRIYIVMTYDYICYVVTLY